MAKGEPTAVDLTRAQQAVARRVAESKATVPELTLQAHVDMEAGLALLERVGASEATVADLAIRACALALREVPRANGSYRDGRFDLHPRVNVGVMLSAQGTLVVPTVFDADLKALAQVAAERHALIDRARSGTITAPELSGATFTVADLAGPDVTALAAPVIPPQAGTLSLGAVLPAPVARDEAVVVRPVMAITLTCDHRILYGDAAAEFLGRVRALLEEDEGLQG